MVNESQGEKAAVTEITQDLIMHHPLAMLVVSSQDGQVLYANAAAVAFYGWRREELLAMKMTEIELMPEAELRNYFDLVNQHLRSSFVLQHGSAGGDVRDVEVHAVPVLWKRQPAIYLVINDITDRLQAEKALWRSAEVQNVLREIAETAARCPIEELYRVVHYQIDRLLPAANVQIYLADEASGELISPYLTDETDAAPKRRPLGNYLPEYAMRQRRAMHVTEADFRNLQAAGEVDDRWVPFREWLGAPLLDGTGQAFGIIIVLTLTNEQGFKDEDVKFLSIVASQLALAVRREQSAEALRRSAGKYRRFAQSLPVPMLYGNRRDKSIEFINKKFMDTFGYTLEDVPTMKKWWEAAYPDEGERQARMRLWQAVVATAEKYNTNIEPSETIISCKNGEKRVFLVSGTIVEEGVLATFTDITEQRCNERLLLATYDRKRKNDLLNDLIRQEAPSNAILSACEHVFGKRIRGSFDCHVVVMDSYKGHSREYWLDRREVYQPLLDSIMDRLTEETMIAWESPHGIGVLHFGEEMVNRGKARQVMQAEEIARSIQRHEATLEVSIGAAERVRNLSELGMCYRQAVVSVHSGKKIWPRRNIFHYCDIGLLQFLPYISDQKQLDYYIERTLEPVLEYDKNKKVKLLPTLEGILLCDNLKSAAGWLSIHYKTLMFRKRQLEQIFGLSLDDMDARLTLASAIKLMKLRAGKGE